MRKVAGRQAGRCPAELQPACGGNFKTYDFCCSFIRHRQSDSLSDRLQSFLNQQSRGEL
ncbi:hypothetical protein [Azotobacter chroococcum]|uniref:hypothetical protein n=1 Tax=Azotobacter chroococcum TaxID=353 RepID=UPI003D33BB64